MGEFKSTTTNFSVPKGEDIRMVYNSKVISLSSSLWEPHVVLPTLGSTLWAVDRGTFIADRDIG